MQSYTSSPLLAAAATVGLLLAVPVSVGLAGCSSQGDGATVNGGTGGAGATGSHGSTVATGSTGGTGATGTGSAGGSGPPGPPGCGLAAAAFCDPFDAPATPAGGREGELDPKKWSVVRTEQAGLGGECVDCQGWVIPVGTATLPPCRAGLPAQVLPDQDILICDTTSAFQSNTLLIAVAEQNYGQIAARVRQPFDFTGRTGEIVFDATLWPGGLLGWIALDITEDPIGAPSFLQLQNEENGAVPRNGLEVHFNQNCQVEDQVSVDKIIVIDDYTQNIIDVSDADRHCVSMTPGQLNHVEVDVSAGHVAISASPTSADGVTFAPVELLTEQDISLPFTTGYVQLSVYNHASVKYSVGNSVDSVIAQFDNVGFDGPVLPVEVGASVPDLLADAPVPTGSIFTKAVNIGYQLGDLPAGGFAAPLSFTPIDLAGAVSAKVTLIWYSLLPSSNGGQGNVSDYELDYRLNGGATHAYHFSADQLAFIAAQLALQQPVSGTLGVSLDVDLTELVSGTNTIEFATTNVPMNYPPIAYDIDLIVSKE
jgi:hypothetical protein